MEVPRTSKEIADKLPNSILANSRTASRVTDAINKGAWIEFPAKTAKGKNDINMLRLQKYDNCAPQGNRTNI